MIAPSPVTTAALLGLDRNAIGWCDLTLNPGLSGCGKVSPACADCYAEDTAAGIVRKGRTDKPIPEAMRATADFYAEGLTPDGRWTGRVSVHPERIGPAFAKLPKRPGARRLRVFVTSMSDLFYDDVPFDFIDAVFAQMWTRPHLDFPVLTKRAERMAAYAASRKARGVPWPANVWAGVTVEDQRRADERIPWLLGVPAAVRWLSVEPMLGAIVPRDGEGGRSALTRYTDFPKPHQATDSKGRGRLWHGIDWLVIGSESDGSRPGARETRHEWITGLVDQCDAAGVPVFVKQAAIGGKLCKLPTVNGRVRAEFPEVPGV